MFNQVQKTAAAVILSLILAQPAHAGVARKIYKTYHYGVYYLVMVGTTLAGGVPVLIGHLNQRANDVLEQAAEEESQQEMNQVEEDPK